MLKTWRPYLIIFIIAFLLFFQTLFFNLTYLDDQALLVDNAKIMQEEGLLGIFSHDTFFSNSRVYYRPLLNLSLFLEMKMDFNNYIIFHFFNIIIHIITVFLIFLILQKLKYKKETSFFLSLVFLVHPVLTQAVAWIPGRNDSLLALMVILSFLILLKFLETKKIVFYLGHIIIFFLALFVKETAIFSPLVFFFYLLLLRKEKIFSVDNRLLYLAWGGALFVYYLIRSFVLWSGDPINFYNIIASLSNNLTVFIIDSAKIFFPVNLKVLSITQNSSLVFAYLSLIIMASIFIYFRKYWRILVFALLWFIIFLLPSLLLQNKSFGVNFNLEHRIYLPMFGIIIILAEVFRRTKINWKNNIVKIIAIIVIIVLATITLIHSSKFKDGMTFWTSAVKGAPRLSFGST